jgi:hypothetical protein
MITQRPPQVIHGHRQPPCLSLGIAPSRSSGSRRTQLGVVERVLRDVRDEFLRGEREEALQARVLAVEPGFLEVVVGHLVWDLEGEVLAEPCEEQA